MKVFESDGIHTVFVTIQFLNSKELCARVEWRAHAPPPTRRPAKQLFASKPVPLAVQCEIGAVGVSQAEQRGSVVPASSLIASKERIEGVTHLNDLIGRECLLVR